jgi:endo-1,4-beta-xylanase
LAGENPPTKNFAFCRVFVLELMTPMKARPVLLALLFGLVIAPVASAQTAAAALSTAPKDPAPLPAVSATSVLPANLSPGGPPIPTTPPTEPGHPPSILLWPNGAPGSEAHKNEAEIVGWRQEPDIVFPIIYNIHDPNITPFLPAKDKATGCAVIVAPGGGHMFQTIGREGYDLGQWLADHGIAAFVLKYRLQRDDAVPRGTPQPYTVAVHAEADAARAMRLIRSRAAEWNVDANHVGIIGFSAGGEVAADLIAADDAGKTDAPDPLDRLDARPNFVGFAYPGLPQSWYAADWTPPKDMPPAFLLCASGDRDNIAGPGGQVKLYNTLRAAKIPVELHIFEEGGHGFGVRDDWSYSVAKWPMLFHDWLNDRGLLKKSANSPVASDLHIWDMVPLQ